MATLSDTELLDDIFDTVSAVEAHSDSPNPDGAANSCDEDFSDDEPVLLPTPNRSFSTTSDSTSKAPASAAMSTSTPAGSSLFRPKPVPTPAAIKGMGRAPLLPSSTNRAGVSVAVGRGGSMVYTAQKAENECDTHCYVVQFRKPQQKKHKTWDGDAYIKVEGRRISMYGDDGKHMGTTALVGGLPGEGSELRIASYDCEVDHEVTLDAFKAATLCLNNPTNAPIQYSPASTSRVTTSSRVTSLQSRTPVSSSRPFKTPTVVSAPHRTTVLVRPLAPNIKMEDESNGFSSTTAVGAASFYAKPPKTPTKKIVIGEKNSKEREAWGGALHDPNAEGAVVMPRPNDEAIKERGVLVNDVVIDPHLSSKMREHQKKGVEFMYRCVMGFAGMNGTGCILADEMGLGKTLQTIALIYTLCKQSPWQNESSVIGRALVVCPVSLVNNWKKEFRKWLPRDFNVIAVENADETQIGAFTHHRGLNVLIIGYERLRKVINRLAACQPPIGLIVCDEGHRLKSKDNKTTKMFDALRTTRRIMLTGTPVQNDLGEYWAMADFCNPGVFGTYSQFNRHFEKPITKSREPKCSDAHAKEGQERMELLYDLTQEFVLRRTAEVLDKYLPPKTEYVIFVAPTALQLDIFTQILGGGKASALLRGQAMAQLATIDLLRKVSNSPMLLRKKDDDGYSSEAIASAMKEAMSLIRNAGRSAEIELSGKMKMLDRMLESVARARDEKIVVVSNWTSTLDLVKELCVKRRYNFLRLDGSTPQKQRQELVDRFNSRDRSDSMVFLLSAKAGGVGLNLIGASRLVLFDSDWNPSTDLQAMARIHRDGQKKPVYIYRLLTTNTIDEKIYQRQITKTGLSDQMMGGGGAGNGKDSKDSFSFEELRDIFSVNIYTDGCQTHDLLGCDCEGKNAVPDCSEEPETRSTSRAGSHESSDDEEANLGFLPASQFNPEPTPKMLRKVEAAQHAKLAALKQWRHMDPFNADSIRKVADHLLYNLARDDYKTYEMNGDKKVTSTSTSTWDTTDVEPAAKKRKVGIMDVINTAREEASQASVPDSEAEDGGDSDEEDFVPSHRKRKSVRLKAVAKTGAKTKIFIATEKEDKKYNLRTIADGGQGGRITYVFERVSKSGYEQK